MTQVGPSSEFGRKPADDRLRKGADSSEKPQFTGAHEEAYSGFALFKRAFAETVLRGFPGVEQVLVQPPVGGEAKKGGNAGDKKTEAERITDAKAIIKDLGDDNYVVRERAKEKLAETIGDLLKKGEKSPVLKELFQGLNSDDPEVRARINSVLDKMWKDAGSNPEKMLQLLAQQEPSAKDWAVNKIVELPEASALKLLPRLAVAAEKVGTEEALDGVRRAAAKHAHSLDTGLFQNLTAKLHSDRFEWNRSLDDVKLDKMTPEERQQAVKKLIADGDKLIKDADKAYSGDLGALARVMHPDGKRIAFASAAGERLASAPGQQRLEVASTFSDFAGELKKAGGDQATIDQLQALAIKHFKESLLTAPEYRRTGFFAGTVDRLRALNPEQFDRLVPLRVRESPT